MTSYRTPFMKRLAVILLLSTVLLVSVSPTLQTTSTSKTSITDSTNTKDNSDFSSLSVGLTPSVGLSSGGLQTSTTASKKAPPQVEKLLVLKAKLLGKEFTTSMTQLSETMEEYVSEYFKEVSYNQTVIVATVIPVNYTMPHDESYYGTNTGSTEPNVKILIEDALTAANSTVTSLGGYSVFRHIVIVHSGEDQAMPPNNPAAITSQFIYGEGGELLILGAVKIMNACVVSNRDPLGVIVHELGHSMGLPDLYDLVASEQGKQDDFVGPWDLMAEGSWNPRPEGSSPSHPTTWCKLKMDWITPSEIVEITESSIQSGHNATVFLNPQELASGTLAIKIRLNNGTYYLVENRQKKGYDAALPSIGVLVLFCDESKASGHGIVRLMSGHPPDLGTLAPYNVGVSSYNAFFGDKGADIGVRVLNKWTNGTFKILVGQWTPVRNAPSEYVGPSIPVAIIAVGCVVFLVLVLVIYVKKGRQKTVHDNGSIPTIKIS